MARPIKDPEIKRASNGRWYLHYHDHAAKLPRRFSLETTDHAEAAQALADFVTGKARVEDEHDPTIGSLLNLYEVEHALKENDVRTAQMRIGLMREHFGKLTLKELERNSFDHVKAYEDKRRHCASGTIRSELLILKAALNYNCKKAKRIRSVPYLPLPAPSKARTRTLSFTEADRLHAEATRRRENTRRASKRLSRLERFAWLALEAPQRKTSILRLEWDRVHFDRGVRGELDYREPGKKETSKKQNVIPISARLLPVLERALAERKPGCKWVMDHPGDIAKSFANLVQAVGLSGKVTPHTLRHTTATNMARAGHSAAKIAKVLGNTEAMVASTYTHLLTSDVQDTVDYRRP